MSDDDAERPSAGLALEFQLDAPPEKVWRAISTPELRERWLPARDLAEPDPVFSAPGEAVGYRMRDPAPPFLASVVTFEVRPGEAGGTRLRIVHDLADARLRRGTPPAANGNRAPLMRAA